MQGIDGFLVGPILFQSGQSRVNNLKLLAHHDSEGFVVVSFGANRNNRGLDRFHNGLGSFCRGFSRLFGSCCALRSGRLCAMTGHQGLWQLNGSTCQHLL